MRPRENAYWYFYLLKYTDIDTPFLVHDGKLPLQNNILSMTSSPRPVEQPGELVVQHCCRHVAAGHGRDTGHHKHPEEGVEVAEISSGDGGARPATHTRYWEMGAGIRGVRW